MNSQGWAILAILEGFAVETTDGLLFTVKGLVHPPDGVVAYLRYLPDLQGDRTRESICYRRVYHFGEQQQVLQAQYPVYLHHDPVFGVRVQQVPRRLIGVVYDPCRHLADLRHRGPGDLVEEQALELADLLQEAAGVQPKDVGITGSLLVGLHRPDSDLDLVVYGDGPARALHGALHRLLDDPSSPVRRPNQEELAALHAMHRLDTPLALADFARLQARKANEGRFQGREVFVRFVKWPREAGEQYGDRRFEPLGSAAVRARVVEDGEAIFTPCLYVVEDVTFRDGPAVEDLLEFVSFRGRFAEQVRAGEWALARGSLERVVTRTGLAYHRLVVGGRPGDYLLAEAP